MDSLIKLENFALIPPFAELFQQGVIVTVLLSVFTVLIGFVLAVILALMRLSNFRPFYFLGLTRDGHLRDGGVLAAISRFNPLSFLATAYVELLRSTPVIVQIMIVYLGVFSVIELPNFTFLKPDKYYARLALCQVDRLHYKIILTTMEQDYTLGIRLKDFAKLCQAEGAKIAYNLDGGLSTTLFFNNKRINEQKKVNFRSIPDIVYFASAWNGEE